jgi:hypothetical protein
LTCDFEWEARKLPLTCRTWQGLWAGWTGEMTDLVSYVVVKLFVDVAGLKGGVTLVLLLAGLAFVACYE